LRSKLTKLIPKHVLITGGSGLIGSRLTAMLREGGASVAHLSRSTNGNRSIPVYKWNVRAGTIDLQALQNTEAIVHLAGAGIADKPWTPRRKQEILESRTLSTALLYRTLKEHPHKVKTVVCASAIGIYGFEGSEEVFTEDHHAGNDFLASVVKAWEAEANKFEDLGVRLVKIRIGVVLSTEGGALKELMRPIKWGLGAPLGKGTQYISWIHIDDLCRLFLFALENEQMQGVFNGVSPNPVTNREFTYTVARALNKKVWLPPVPAFVLRMLLGEMADLVLKGSRVSAQKVLQQGFKFHYPQIEEAVHSLLR
jgi:uncharacterized protein (TIGR01777 family)